MKNLIIIILFLFSVNTFSQKLNGFKFVYVPNIVGYKAGFDDYYGLEKRTKDFFQKLGYEIINTTNEKNSIKNKCEILNIGIAHTGNRTGYNTVTFNLYDCNGSFTSFKDRGYSDTPYGTGSFRQASKKALKWFLEKKIKKYSFDSSFTPILKVAKVNQNKGLNFLDEQSIRDFLLKKELEPMEGIWQYANTDGASSEYKLLILKEEFKYNLYIIEGSGLWNPSDKKAEFETAASEKVITIKWTMGDKKTIIKAIGEVKDNAIIEFTLPNNKNKTTLYKVYPKFDSNSKRKTSKNGEWAGNGSGVIISKSGHIITNHHVIEDAEKIEVEFMLDDELQKFNAEVVQVDKTNDLAVLKIFDMNFDGVSEPPYNFKFRGSDVGTKVYAFGYPMALSIMGKEIKVTDGMISSKTGFDGNITTYQITAPIQGGNSGGPLFDEEANLIGINSSGIRKDIADNVAYSIKTSYVSNLLDVLPKSIELPSSTRLKSLPLTEQIKEISKYVVLVKVK